LHLLQVLNYVALVNFAKIFNVRKAMKILIWTIHLISLKITVAKLQLLCNNQYVWTIRAVIGMIIILQTIILQMFLRMNVACLNAIYIVVPRDIKTWTWMILLIIQLNIVVKLWHSKCVQDSHVVIGTIIILQTICLQMFLKMNVAYLM
jgi:hypothetical protein